MKRTLTSLAVVAGVVALSGCEPEWQDQGSAMHSFSGSVIDPYIQNGYVWADLDGDGELNRTAEPFVRTDAEGNYADLHIPVAAFDNGNRIILRTKHGFDQWTGQAASGQMLLSVGSEDATSTGVISPLSSLEANQAGLVETLFADAFDSSRDFLTGEQADAELAADSIRVHKTLAVLAGAMADDLLIGDDEGIDSTVAMDALYTALAADAADSAVLSLDASQLQRVMESAYYQVTEQDVEARTGRMPNWSHQLAVASELAAVLGQAEYRRVGVNGGLHPGAVRLAEMWAAKARNSRSSDLLSFIDELSNLDSDLLNGLIDAMAEQGAEFDLNRLVRHGFDGSSVLAELLDDLQVTEDMSLPVGFGERDYRFTLVEGDLGEDQYKVAFIFGDGDADEDGKVFKGDLSLCWYYQDADGSDELATEGTLVKSGEWVRLASNRLVLNVDFPVIGTVSPNLVLHGPEDKRDPDALYRYGFDISAEGLGDASEEWTSTTSPADWEVSVDNRPETDADCQAMFSSL